MRKKYLLLCMLALLSQVGYAQGYESKGAPISSEQSYSSSAHKSDYESNL